MWPKHVMDGMQPMVYNSFRTPSPSPVLPTPSASPLPIVAPNVMPVSIPSNSAEGLGKKFAFRYLQQIFKTSISVWVKKFGFRYQQEDERHIIRRFFF